MIHKTYSASRSSMDYNGRITEEAFAMAEHIGRMILIAGAIVCVLAASGCVSPVDDTTPTPATPAPSDDRAYRSLINRDCVDCHAVQYFSIENGSGRHAHLNCTFCHIQHGYQPDCRSCHPEKHGRGIQGCMICHQNPHAPEERINDPRMNSSVCQPCHIPQYDAIEEGTGRHSTIRCGLCHIQHGYLPTCSDCHGLPHGHDVLDCASCHDPHIPEHIEFDYRNNTECERCHLSAIKQTFLTTYTRHADLSCDMCHPVHAATRLCIECHPGHSTEMSMRDCNNCHRIGHVPTEIRYSPDTKSVVCVECHAKPFNTMIESGSEHIYIECVECHPGHGVTIACTDCHTPDSSHGTECDDCHGYAHDLTTRGQE